MDLNITINELGMLDRDKIIINGKKCRAINAIDIQMCALNKIAVSLEIEDPKQVSFTESQVYLNGVCLGDKVNSVQNCVLGASITGYLDSLTIK